MTRGPGAAHSSHALRVPRACPGPHLFREGKYDMIPENHLREVCRLGEGSGACVYLGIGRGGWQCLKLTGLRNRIDSMRLKGEMTAAGDNCDGLEPPASESA
jgi:hypothetical protein